MLLIDDMGLLPLISHHWSCALPNSTNITIHITNGKTLTTNNERVSRGYPGSQEEISIERQAGEVIPYHK